MTVPAGKLPLPELAEMKRRGDKIVMVTAYDAPGARFAEDAGVDLILVGDTAAMVVLGHEGTTVPVTMDEMLFLTKTVARAAYRPIVVGDMPFGSYQVSDEDAVRNAIRFVKEAEADVCFSVVLEAVPAPVAAEITRRLTVPTIGIGAGVDCDGQVLVYHDLLGLTEGHLPRFVKRYANLSREIRDALESYAEEVRSGTFPEEQHTYEMPEDEREAFESSSLSPRRSSTSAQAAKTSSTEANAQLPAPRSEPPLRKTSSP